MIKPKKVRIEISGGVAEVISKSRGVTLEIYDHDSAKEDADYDGEEYDGSVAIYEKQR